jgi:hypothetical protein
MKSDMPFTRKQVERFHKDYEESARLRVAAPMLLDTLKTVDCHFDDIQNGGLGFGKSEILSLIKKAIAKAEGGE